MDLQVFVVPHSHIDTEWYWTYDTTIDWAFEIIQEALHRVAQDPTYHFTQDQVSVMAPVWDRLSNEDQVEWRDAVARGQWEPLLGLLTSPELAEPSGESLVRQILAGQSWTEEHLGQKAQVAWFIDQFGQIPQLPQILRQAGYRGYVFGRDLPPDRDVEEFPADFWYEGPDGSRILTHWMPAHYSVGPGNLAEKIVPLAHHSQHGVWLVPWGGDVVRPEMSGKDIVDAVARHVWKRVPNAGIRLATPSQYFDAVAECGTELPSVNWDFNPPQRIQDLRGTFDNRSGFKIRHRWLESALVATEAFAGSFGMVAAEVRAALRPGWQALLLSEFHDTMGGSCSDRVFERALERLALAEDVLIGIQARVLAGGLGAPGLCVFNSLGFRRQDRITVLPPDATSLWTLCDAGGNLLPSRQVAPGSPVTSVVALDGLDSTMLTWARHPGEPTVTRRWMEPTTADIMLETPGYRVCVRPQTGTIPWIRNRTGAGLWQADDLAHRVEVWHETNPDLEGPLDLDGRRDAQQAPPDECWIEESPLGYEVGVGRPAFGGRLRQIFFFGRHTPRIDCDVYLDGVRMPDGLLVVRFPRETGAPIRYETPFAITARPEGHYAAQTFAASGGQRGLAVANRGTPGYWFEADTWYLVLLRAANHYDGYRRSAVESRAMYAFPGMERHLVPEFIAGKSGTVMAREIGNHHFQYAVIPFDHDLPGGQVAEHAHAFNQPFIVGNGSLPVGNGGPPVRVEGHPVLLDAFKPAEDGNGWILRFHEPYGHPGQVALTVSSRFAGMQRATLCEEDLGPYLKQARVACDIGPYEIQTWRLTERS